MIDIHCHILPYLDDGAYDIDEAVNMARLAYANGTTAIVATPHSDIEGAFDSLWREEVSESVAELNNALAAQGIDIKFYPGCEMLCMGDFKSQLKLGAPLTLNHSKHLLVEFDFYEHGASVYIKLQQILAEGYMPIVAHPERYECVSENMDLIRRLKELGCLIQVNKGSIEGSFGQQVCENAHRILSEGYADFVASDAHGAHMRTPSMRNAYHMVCDMYSEDYARLLFETNPAKLVKRSL